ncbi:PIG-L family deacetylase [Virgibacillus sp. MSP4-1]|uniref:PIG-L deacetylase family protein n=1 Tax=Virgibacillus sp. MSP4-1 TaxID=2700081 RepID=UPI0003A8CA94|nr:PIG-L family deacetylase [Virgibacillus sp. MSP4-1]QHS23512.1 PIG-L family deacetylase [Virgibacillus sp. MSP4-1]
MGLKQTIMDLSEPIVIPITKLVLSRHYAGNRYPSQLGAYKRIAVLAPHMDDETIGVGGTIRRHANEGAKVHCIFTTDGSSSVTSMDRDELSNQRKQEMNKVKHILGIHQIHYMDLPDGHVQSNVKSQNDLLKILKEIQPDLIYCTPFIDAHPDHLATTQLLADTLKRTDLHRTKIRLYDVNCPIPPSEVNCIIDITDSFSDKSHAIELFSSQTIAFDGFLLLNQYKAKLIKHFPVHYAEVFIQLSVPDFTKQQQNTGQMSSQYPSLFKQVNRTVTLLWAVFKNFRLKKRLYQSRYVSEGTVNGEKSTNDP